MTALHVNSRLDLAVSHGEWSAIRRQAERLGYAGLIPFVTLAALHLLLRDDAQQYTGQALVNYGAVIISFLGATHWVAVISGVSITNAPSRMLFAILPALLGWTATLVPLIYGLFLILASLGAIYLVDSRWGVFHSWYLTLRRRLTLVASLSVAVVFISIFRSL